MAAKFNPYSHRRRSIRLKGYDYSRDGAYFVTLCTFDRGCHFEHFGRLRHIVQTRWQGIPERFPGALLDEFVIMPNHLHGIVVLCRDTPCGYPGMVPANDRAPARGAPTLGDVVGSFKSLCVTDWLKVIKAERLNAVARFWQSNYYEHVIRDDDEMDRIRRYIIENPSRWELDRENPACTKPSNVQEEKWMV